MEHQAIHNPRAPTSDHVSEGRPYPSLRRLRASAPLTDAASLALLLLLVALFFWRIWTPNPADRVAFPLGDFTEQYYPLRYFVASTLDGGRLPFWNPFIFGGQPGLADQQAAALYPPSLLNALLWGKAFSILALELEVIAHIAIAAVGTYLFIRSALGLAPLPALTGAIVYGLGGYLTGFPIEQVTLLATITWVPWLLLMIHHASQPQPRSRRLVWIALGGLMFMLALLGGFPQTELYVAYLSGAFALFEALRNRSATQSWLTTLLPAASIFALGAGLAAPQLLPTASFIAESSRLTPTYHFVQGGLTWDEITLMFIPKIVGSTPHYVGITTLLLAVLGFLSAGQRGAKRFWGLVALLSLLLALGGNSILFDPLYLFLPGLNKVRQQERVLFVWSWSLSLLAAWGSALILSPTYDRQVRVWLRRTARALTVLLPILLLPWLLIGLAWSQLGTWLSLNLQVFEPFYTHYSALLLAVGVNMGLFWGAAWGAARRQSMSSGRWVGGLLCALLVGELFLMNRAAHLGGPLHEAVAPRTEVVEALYAWQAEAPSRVDVVGEPLPRSNDGMYWGFPLLSGNEPLRLKVVADFMAQALPWTRLQAFGAGYIIADQPLHTSNPAVYEFLAYSAHPTPSYLLRVRQPVPHAWLVGHTQTFAAPAQLYDHLAQVVPDLYTVALLEQPLTLSGQHYAPGEHVQVLQRAPDVLIEVNNPAQATNLLLIAEPASQGWQTTLDGAPVPWIRANGVNIALPIPPGQHQVRLHYEAPGWRLGVGLSAISALLVLGMLVQYGLTIRRAPTIPV